MKTDARARVLVAIDPRAQVLGLAVTGTGAEYDHDFGLKDGGVTWDDVLPHAAGKPAGLYVWEGSATPGDEGIHYEGEYRQLTEGEWARLRAGDVQLWERGPVYDPSADVDEDRE